MTRHWAADLIGTPWTESRNCWWLVREVLRRRAIDLPPMVGIGDISAADSVAAIMAAAAASGWAHVSGPARELDVVLCRDLTGKRHAGIMVAFKDGLELLHSDGHMGERGPVGSVVRVPLAQASQLTSIELWRRV